MKIYRILLILVATIISLATIGQSWDVHQAIQQGRPNLESKGNFDLSEDQWNDNGDRYILSNSMKSIYFIGSTYIARWINLLCKIFIDLKTINQLNFTIDPYY